MSEEPPVEWVYLRNPHSNVSEDKQTSGFCKFIDKFYWRKREGEPNELHISFCSDGNDEDRYKYYDVDREVYNKAWNLAHNPGEFDTGFGSWFSSEIEGKYDYDKYK